MTACHRPQDHVSDRSARCTVPQRYIPFLTSYSSSTYLLPPDRCFLVRLVVVGIFSFVSSPLSDCGSWVLFLGLAKKRSMRALLTISCSISVIVCPPIGTGKTNKRRDSEREKA